MISPFNQEGSSADISGFGVVIEPVSGALKHPTELQTARHFLFSTFTFYNASPELIQILLQGDPHIKVCLPQLVGNQVSSHLCVENDVAVGSGDDDGGAWCCCFYCYYFLKTFPTVQRQPNLCRWDPEGGKQPRSRSGKNFQISFHHQ